MYIYTYQGQAIDGGLTEHPAALEKLSQWRGPQNIFGVINLNSIILQTMSISKEIQKISDHLFDVPKQSQIETAFQDGLMTRSQGAPALYT